MAADIDGNGTDELIGRGPNGILAYRWNTSTQRWSSMVTNAPALSDALWASDPAYWASLRTAKIDGQKHALLARGSSGMRRKRTAATTSTASSRSLWWRPSVTWSTLCARSATRLLGRPLATINGGP